MPRSYDVVIVGAGPNGLSAAIAFGRAGLSTLVVEASDTPGGGARTKELMFGGMLHDICSTNHPLGVTSPWFRALELDAVGLEWAHSPAALAHVLGDGRVALLHQSLDATAELLGADGPSYRRLMEPFVEEFDTLQRMVLAPLRFPRDPGLMARFGIEALRSLTGLSKSWFDGDEAPALLAGIAAHAMVPLDRLATASFGIILAAAGHAAGWPVARGGSQAITNALLTRLDEVGGEIIVGQRVGSLDELPAARAYVLDVTPRQLLAIAGDRLPARDRDRFAKFRYGPGVFKIDWALNGPVPWRDPRCALAATVHLSGTIDDVAAAEQAVHDGHLAERPFVLFGQPSVCDPSRVPPGMHVAWAYCHVPHGSGVDATQAIEDQVERAAPGFRDVVTARLTTNAHELERYNANYVGGDINGGYADARQLLFRPVPRLDPYATGAPNIFLCSSSTPPGGGVHGMCGYWAAKSVLSKVFDRAAPPLAGELLTSAA
ncbi:MAG: NAD(P)/FAD-dependent oxidoreductase [Deltaproteobacteria bacterium]|nr:NAD(P)/FAD-dependent oxidoreductase [Deltaproteobacteria bacterium]